VSALIEMEVIVNICCESWLNKQ